MRRVCKLCCIFGFVFKTADLRLFEKTTNKTVFCVTNISKFCPQLIFLISILSSLYQRASTLTMCFFLILSVHCLHMEVGCLSLTSSDTEMPKIIEMSLTWSQQFCTFRFLFVFVFNLCAHTTSVINTSFVKLKIMWLHFECSDEKFLQSSYEYDAKSKFTHLNIDTLHFPNMHFMRKLMQSKSSY